MSHSTSNPTQLMGASAATGVGGSNYLTATRGIKSWIFTLDHKRIALMYMFAILGAFFLGGVFAVLLRTELLTPGPTFSSDVGKASDFYNHMFTLHGAVMTFMFIIPAIPAIMGNFLLPLMLGAKDLAFPRINLLSFYLYVAGAIFFTFILFGGTMEVLLGITIPGAVGLDTGWTFYTPYSTDPEVGTHAGVIAATFGAFILGFSSILTGLNFIATIHMMRPPGMRWFRMPLSVWSFYATSIIQILATPVLGITLLLLIAERVLHVGIFTPSLGGDPVLYQHFFWFYSHPAVYIMILPAMGIISELMSTFSRKHIFGYRFIALSSLAIALLSFLVWGHHMFVSGQGSLAAAVFSLLTFSVSIPSAIKVFNWIATMYKGSIVLKTPMIYAMGFIFLFTIGGLTGLFLGSLSTNTHLHDTYFIVAHFHYVMMGSTLFAFLGGMYYWFPKMFGRMYSETWGRWAAIMVFIGFNLTFMPQFIAGALGMPRRYATYEGPLEVYTIYHQLSTVGAYVMTLGLLMVLGTWFLGARYGRAAAANPFGSNTLEWHCSSPPPAHNFDQPPAVGDPYELGHLEYDPEIDGYVQVRPDPTIDLNDDERDPALTPGAQPAGGLA